MFYNFLFAINFFGNKQYLPDSLIFYMIIAIGILLLITLVVIITLTISYMRRKNHKVEPEKPNENEKPLTAIYKVIIGCKDKSVLDRLYIQLSKDDKAMAEGVKPCSGNCEEFVLFPDTYKVELLNVPDGYKYESATVTSDIRVATIDLVAIEQKLEPESIQPETVPESTIAVAADNIIRYDRSFQARLIQSDDSVKYWYSDLKNDLLSYKKVHDRLSWKRESYRFGREPVVLMAFRGKTLCLFFPLAPQDFNDSKYKIEDASDMSFAENTPCMYRIKNDRRVKYAKELIALVMERYGSEKVERKSENYYVPYAKTEKLIKKGLIKQKVSTEAAEEFIRSRQSDDDE